MTTIEQDLIDISKQIRMDIINMIADCHMGHPGSSLSCVEILVALYFAIMRVNANNPDDSCRDRFILSKGHASPTLYSVLAHKGFFPISYLSTFRRYGSHLTAYPDMDTPGVDMESGSLGNGLSAGVGMALSAKMKQQDYNVYVVLGDGELEEGMVWEAAMCAAHHKVDNLIAFIDKNELQIRGRVSDIMNIDPIDDKFKAFGWNTINIDGHNFSEIINAVNLAHAIKNKPTVIIAHTIKGKGVSFMENVAIWHRHDITEEQRFLALKEIKNE